MITVYISFKNLHTKHKVFSDAREIWLPKKTMAPQ